MTNLWIYQGRYKVEISHVPVGTWVLIGGTIYFGFTTELTAGTASEIARMLLEGAK